MEMDQYAGLKIGHDIQNEPDYITSGSNQMTGVDEENIVDLKLIKVLPGYLFKRFTKYFVRHALDRFARTRIDRNQPSLKASIINHGAKQERAVSRADFDETLGLTACDE